ncbi:hypothetical protein K1S22_26945, partial [Klebsiella pneumoniae]|nr:hypothetical protein [Klebsiella pneumoniae]
MMTQQDKGYLTDSPIGAWGTPSPRSSAQFNHSAVRLRAISTHMSKMSIELGRTAILLKLSGDNASTET